jgi:hypothetical protein
VDERGCRRLLRVTGGGGPSSEQRVPVGGQWAGDGDGSAGSGGAGRGRRCACVCVAKWGRVYLARARTLLG